MDGLYEKYKARVILVGHSYGGIVARYTVSHFVDLSGACLKRSNEISGIQGKTSLVLTFATPHAAPILMLRPGASSLYAQMHKCGTTVPLLSVTGEENDVLITPSFTKIHSYISFPLLFHKSLLETTFPLKEVKTSDVRGLWTSIRHQRMVVCNPLVQRMAPLLLEFGETFGHSEGLANQHDLDFLAKKHLTGSKPLPQAGFKSWRCQEFVSDEEVFAIPQVDIEISKEFIFEVTNFFTLCLEFAHRTTTTSGMLGILQNVQSQSSGWSLLHLLVRNFEYFYNNLKTFHMWTTSLTKHRLENTIHWMQGQGSFHERKNPFSTFIGFSYSLSKQVRDGRDYLSTATWLLYLPPERLQNAEAIHVCLFRPDDTSSFFFAVFKDESYDPIEIRLSLWHIVRSTSLQLGAQIEENKIVSTSVVVDTSKAPQWLRDMNMKIHWKVKSRSLTDCSLPIEVPQDVAAKQIGSYGDFQKTFLVSTRCHYFVSLSFSPFDWIYDRARISLGSTLVWIFVWTTLLTPIEPFNRGVTFEDGFWKKIALSLASSLILNMIGCRSFLLWLGFWMPEKPLSFGEISSRIFVVLCSKGLMEWMHSLFVLLWMFPSLIVKDLTSNFVLRKRIVPIRIETFSKKTEFCFACLWVFLSFYFHPALFCFLSIEIQLIQLVLNKIKVEDHSPSFCDERMVYLTHSLSHRLFCLSNVLLILFPSFIAWIGLYSRNRHITALDVLLSLSLGFDLFKYLLPFSSQIQLPAFQRYSPLHTWVFSTCTALISMGFTPAWMPLFIFRCFTNWDVETVAQRSRFKTF